MKRICRLCKNSHARLTPLCGSCVKVRAAHSQEVMRQESRLMMRGWLPSGLAVVMPATSPIIVRNDSDSTDH